MWTKFLKLRSLSMILMVFLWGCIIKNQAAPAVLPSATSVPTAALPQTPLPFTYLEEVPNGEFLYVHIEDFYTHCIDGHCDCPAYVGEGEPPVPPVLEEDGNFKLNPNLFQPPLTDWLNIRKKTKLLALYSNYSPQHADLQYYSIFPIETPIGGFTILGVDLGGDIQVKINNGFAIIPAGSSLSVEQSEKINSECTYIHEYALHNYGLVRDEDVVIGDF